MKRGWLVGPLVATITLAILRFVVVGLYASGGGLLIATGIAAWTAGGAAALASERHRTRNVAISVLYVILIMVGYLVIADWRSRSSGMPHGGPNVPPPF